MIQQKQPEIASTRLRTAHGEFEFHCFAWGPHEEDNILCLSNPAASDSVPLCRVQSACYTAEIFQSLDCDCHAQLHQSLSLIQLHGGILVYVLCDGRGAGLMTKTLGLELGRVEGLDTSDAYGRLGVQQDPREYSRPAFALKHLGFHRVKLLTNNPRKLRGLGDHGISVEREPLEISATADSRPYLETKAKKMGHLLSQFAGDAPNSQ
jgi:GTP cyclohydrolase II